MRYFGEKAAQKRARYALRRQPCKAKVLNEANACLHLSGGLKCFSQQTEQMRQLISVSFEMCMKEYLLLQTKNYCKASSISDSTMRKRIFNIMRRKALFLGLSDGSHMDYFRRQNPMLSNEQVFINYDFSNERALGMKDSLKQDLTTLCKDTGYSLNEDDSNFRTFFLIDDFSASGISYIRMEDGKWKGKIPKFYNLLGDIGFPKEDISIHV